MPATCGLLRVAAHHMSLHWIKRSSGSTISSMYHRILLVRYYYSRSPMLSLMIYKITYASLIVVFLPMPLIWSLHMPRTQNLAVSSICSLAIITVGFETVRTVKLYQNNFNLTNLYSYLELLVAVITSMLPSFRFMVSPSPKDREYRRLFWTAITLRSTHSNSSGYSMHSYDQASRRSASSRHINVQTTVNLEDQEVPPLPTQNKS